MFRRSFLTLIAAALLGACSAQEGVEAPVPARAPGSAAVYPGFVVPEGQALLTLYRPVNLLGGGITYHFSINGARTPGMDLRTRYTEVVPPGPVHIEGIWLLYTPRLDFVAEEGAAYFIVVTPNILDGGPQISHAEPGAAAAQAAQMEPVN